MPAQRHGETKKSDRTPSKEELGLEGLSSQDAEALAAAAMGKLFDAAVYLDDAGVVMACSPGLLERVGLGADAVVGRPFKELGDGDDERARLAIALLDARGGGAGIVSVKLRSEGLRALPAKVRLVPAHAGGARKWLATMTFWSAGSEDRSPTMALADFDPVTGMLGRGGFLHAGSKAFDRDGFRDRPCLIALDLVDLGGVNRRFGQEAGDKVIDAVAQRLLAQLRRGDLAARLGSDEFCLYASFAGNRGDAEAIATRLEGTLSAAFDLAPGESHPVGAILGVAMGPADGADIGALLSAAERALKRAKAAGKTMGWAESEEKDAKAAAGGKAPKG